MVFLCSWLYMPLRKTLHIIEFFEKRYCITRRACNYKTAQSKVMSASVKYILHRLLSKQIRGSESFILIEVCRCQWGTHFKNILNFCVSPIIQSGFDFHSIFIIGIVLNDKLKCLLFLNSKISKTYTPVIWIDILKNSNHSFVLLYLARTSELERNIDK